MKKGLSKKVVLVCNVKNTFVYKDIKLLEKIGFKVDNWPLSSYRRTSFYTMRTDSRDRFGTPLEQRFSRSEILAMMQAVWFM